MNFAAIPASCAWEPISIADAVPNFVWVWFKPAWVPQGFVARFAEGAFVQQHSAQPLTMRKLLGAIGIDPRSVGMWQQFGVPIDSRSPTTTSFDQAIPAPPPGVPPDIVVYVTMTDALAVSAAPQAVDATPYESISPLDIFESIEASWNASLEIEKKLKGHRKMLSDLLARLNALNRDLSFDEQMYSDREDRNDWNDARRWLRDVAARLSRYIKEHDVGETTSALKRRWFDETYRRFVVARQPFEGMHKAVREYEGYRKMVQSLLNNMTAAHSNAAQDGERRAQQVLNRIASKVRRFRTKSRNS